MVNILINVMEDLLSFLNGYGFDWINYGYSLMVNIWNNGRFLILNAYCLW